MGLIISLIILLACCFAINYFADMLGEELSNIGKKLKIPSVVRGATLDSISSSLPELLTVLVGVLAVLQGNKDAFNDIGLGTIGGSALFNLLLIPMVSVLFYKGSINIEINKRTAVRDMIFYIGSILVLFVSALLGYFNIITGIVLLSLYGCYIYSLILDVKKHRIENEDEEIDEDEESNSLLKSSIISLVTLVPIALSVHFAVHASTVVATTFGIPQIIISLIILAGVTSIPDMFISIRSSKNGELDASISNAVGSNIFDICVCLGIGLLFAGRINVNLAEVAYIFFFLALSSVITSGLFLFKITKKNSLILLGTYALFIIYLLIK